MGCGESKHAVATDNTITSKPLKDDANPNTNAATETVNGIENAPQGEKKDDFNAETIKDAAQAPGGNDENVKEIVGENGELPSQVENVKDDENKNEGAVVPEGKEDLKEENVDNQETVVEKTSSNEDVAAEKTKEEDSINQNNEVAPKEETIPNAKETVAEESKKDSKAN